MTIPVEPLCPQKTQVLYQNKFWVASKTLNSCCWKWCWVLHPKFLASPPETMGFERFWRVARALLQTKRNSHLQPAENVPSQRSVHFEEVFRSSLYMGTITWLDRSWLCPIFEVLWQLQMGYFQKLSTAFILTSLNISIAKNHKGQAWKNPEEGSWS